MPDFVHGNVILLSRLSAAFALSFPRILNRNSLFPFYNFIIARHSLLFLLPIF